MEVARESMPSTGKVRFRWVILLWAFLLNCFVNGFSTAVVAPLLPEIAEELSLTHSQLGIIWGAQAMGLMFFALVGGNIGDRFGVRRVVSLALVAAAMSCSARALFPSFWTLTGAMFSYGVSLAFIVPNLTKAIGQWFHPTELGMANGLLLVGASTGVAIGSMLSAAVLSPLLGGWKGVMWLAAGFTVLLWVGWTAQTREPPLVGAIRHNLPPAGFCEVLKKVLTIRELWLLSTLEFCIVGSWIAWHGMLPDILVLKGISAGTAGIFLSMGIWAATACNIIGPYASDRLRTRKLFIWPSLILVTICWSIQGFTMGTLLIISIVLIGVSIGIVIPILRTLILEIEEVGPHSGGSAIGFAFTLNRFGAFIWPIVMGALIDRTGLPWPPLVLLGFIGLIGLGASLFVKETRS